MTIKHDVSKGLRKDSCTFISKHVRQHPIRNNLPIVCSTYQNLPYLQGTHWLSWFVTKLSRHCSVSFTRYASRNTTYQLICRFGRLFLLRTSCWSSSEPKNINGPYYFAARRSLHKFYYKACHATLRENHIRCDCTVLCQNAIFQHRLS